MATLKEKVASYWERIEPFLRHRYFTLFSRIVLGGIFIFAGAVKINHIYPLYPEGVKSLFQEIMEYKILPQDLAIAYSYVLPPLEILLGILLISGIFLRSGAIVSGLVTLSFTIAKVSALIRHLDIGICGCFGPTVPLLSTQSLALDFVMLALAVQIFFHRGEFLSLGPWIKNVADRSKGEGA
jgi:uncharacterized membrane protein YphA (DoxX/SURF4 family)